MAMRDWFSRKQPPKTVGKSDGGSRLISYDNADPAKPAVGFTDESTLPNTEDRERVYAEIFGDESTVYHEMLPLVPHIDVYCVKRTGDTTFYTYVTGGMSDLPMHSPDELGIEYRRAELVFYATEENQRYAELLRRLAHFVHDNSSWFHWGHTMPNGMPAEPLFDDGPLDTLFFMPSILQPDSTLGEHLSIAGDPVNLVWCVPITTAECQLKLDHGTDALYDLFDQYDHPVIFPGDRKCLVNRG